MGSKTKPTLIASNSRPLDSFPIDSSMFKERSASSSSVLGYSSICAQFWLSRENAVPQYISRQVSMYAKLVTTRQSMDTYKPSQSIVVSMVVNKLLALLTV